MDEGLRILFYGPEPMWHPGDQKHSAAHYFLNEGLSYWAERKANGASPTELDELLKEIKRDAEKVHSTNSRLEASKQIGHIFPEALIQNLQR